MHGWMDVVAGELGQATDQCVSPDWACDCVRQERYQSIVGPQLSDMMTLTLDRHH